jgi:hypothetical protein
MIGHDQHREAAGTDMGFEPVDEQIDLLFETRADIVDRREQDALPGGARRVSQVCLAVDQ